MRQTRGSVVDYRKREVAAKAEGQPPLLCRERAFVERQTEPLPNVDQSLGERVDVRVIMVRAWRDAQATVPSNAMSGWASGELVIRRNFEILDLKLPVCCSAGVTRSASPLLSLTTNP
jgi:hypothetical protein